jgi:hypothetical protein
MEVCTNNNLCNNIGLFSGSSQSSLSSLNPAGAPRGGRDVIASSLVLGVLACHRPGGELYLSSQGYDWFCSLIAGQYALDVGQFLGGLSV